MATIRDPGITGRVGSIEVTNSNVQEVLENLDDGIERILTMIGIKAEKAAKGRCPVGTPKSTGIKGYRGGTLRNSITFNVDMDRSGGTLSIGTNVEYAPYVELGTGPYFDSPPAWLEYTAKKGSGIGHGYVRPRPFLRPAIEDHIEEYKNIIDKELRNA